MTSRGVLPRYSYEYWIWASQMLAKQCCFSSSQRCRSCDCQVKAWELSTCRRRRRRVLTSGALPAAAAAAPAPSFPRSLAQRPPGTSRWAAGPRVPG